MPRPRKDSADRLAISTKRADGLALSEQSRCLRFVTDEDVPDQVGRFLRSHNHEVLLVREQFGEGWSDRMVVEGCEALKANVITLNKRDFVKLIGRRPPDGNFQRYRHVGAIYIQCPEPTAVKRFEQLIDFIDFEFARAEKHPDKRVFITIDERQIQIER